MRIQTSLLHALVLILAYSLNAAPISELIVVDQLGYRPASDKWFMIAVPVTGQNAGQGRPPASEVQIRRTSDLAVVQSISLQRWSNGAVHSSSGDRVWQGEFSNLRSPGTYHIYDPANDVQSFDFDIREDAYNSILTASTKSYYYQRSGTAITPEYGEQWTHGPAHIANQLASRMFDNSLGGIQPESTALDITGGWYDAGDYRKYTSWMAEIIWDLGTAYEWWPSVFGDQSGIPESGNGTPDILDEIMWEIQWMLKMQRPDGALYSGVFVIRRDQGFGNGVGDPSTEDRPYYYANISTSATASGAASFAIASRLLAPFESSWPGASARLREAAIRAWQFLANHPSPIHYDHSGFDNADANKNSGAELRLRVLAAAELFRLTGDAAYRDWFDQYHAHPSTSDSSHNPIINGYFESGGSFDLQRAMITYCQSAGATPSITAAIRQSLDEGVRRQTYGQRHNDPYKCFMWDGHYTWSSNGLKAQWAMIALWAAKLQTNPGMTGTYLALAEEYLHYYHGRNPLGWTFITQAQRFGADKPITQIYHGWFHDGTKWDTNPAPGILAGGPNQYFSPDSSYRGIISPPQNQPPMKSYKDWNASWPENSWSVTENSTGYQSRYTFVLAAFASGPTTPPQPSGDPSRVPLYRFHRADNNSHFFTASEAEKSNVIATMSATYALEGISHHVLAGATPHAMPVYRLYNRISGSHFYTMTVSERDSVLSDMPDVFSLEGIAFHALAGPVSGALPVYRFYASRTASHFFTISEAEKQYVQNNVPESVLRYEGIAWWAFP